jgi:hypothetical protein
MGYWAKKAAFEKKRSKNLETWAMIKYIIPKYINIY